MKVLVERDVMALPPSCCEAVKSKLKSGIRTLLTIKLGQTPSNTDSTQILVLAPFAPQHPAGDAAGTIFFESDF
jgi:hypothetical protein